MQLFCHFVAIVIFDCLNVCASYFHRCSFKIHLITTFKKQEYIGISLTYGYCEENAKVAG